MIDVLEELLEALEEEEYQGVSLEIPAGSATPVSQRGAAELVAADDGWGALSVVAGADEYGEEHPVETGVGSWEQTLGAVGRSGAEGMPMARRMAQVEQAAQRAQSMTRGGADVVAPGETWTGLGALPPTTSGQTVATVERARAMDRAIERDARRYDGGFLLG